MRTSRTRCASAFVLVACVLAGLTLVPASAAAAATTDLLFSEYVEGSSNNKALEIYNGTSGPVDLAAGGYAVKVFFNGAVAPGLTINLTGTVAPGDEFILAHSSAAASILAVADQTTGAGWFNGDDALVLYRGATVVDSIGQVGFDPGFEWGSGLASTADNTLRRRVNVTAGDTNVIDPFDPAAEWDGFATDTFDGLGFHATGVFISEYVEGSSNNKAVEIFNGTPNTIDLAAGAYNLKTFFNGSLTPGLTINLTGTLTPGDVWVVAHSSAAPSILAVADQTSGAGWFNGDDAVVLYQGGTVLDAIGQVGLDPGSEWGVGTTGTADNTLRRRPTVVVGDTVTNDLFDPAVEWSGFPIDTFGDLGRHGVPATGSITFTLNSIPDDAQDFAFTVSGSGTSPFTLDDDADPLLANTITFPDLAAGATYTATQSLPVAGWDLTGLSCSSANASSSSVVNLGTGAISVTLGADDAVVCEFENTKRASVKIVKTVAGQPVSGTDAFHFQLRQGASVAADGTILESVVADASNGGVVTFTTGLIPGSTYQMCEIVMPGWQSTLGVFVPSSFVPPGGVASNPDLDNSILCVDFTAAAGETVTFTVDNAPPTGGDGRAAGIGFWKNWASCAKSNGNQEPVLDETLASAPNGALAVGELTVDTCLEAVRILNRSRVDTDKKQANDPLFTLAAQLLAARLNRAAGAVLCADAVAAMGHAQQFLEVMHFTGTTHAPPSQTQAKEARALAVTLADYNANELC